MGCTLGVFRVWFLSSRRSRVDTRQLNGCALRYSACTESHQRSGMIAKNPHFRCFTSSTFQLVVIVCFMLTARAGSVTFVSFDVPGAVDANVGGISNDGSLVGSYQDQNGFWHRFERLANGSIVTGIDFPGITPSFGGGTELYGINNSGTIVGNFQTGQFSIQAFTLNSGVFAPVTVNGYAAPFLYGINDAGDLAGAVEVSQVGPYHGFIQIGNTQTVYDVGTITFAGAINNLDQTVGSYLIPSSEDGYIRNADGTYLSIPFLIPSLGAVAGLGGINDFGVVTGAYVDSVFPNYHNFYGTPGNITLFEIPGSGGSTSLTGINNAGQMDGTYVDSQGVTHGFVATVDTPEPAETALLGAALVAIALFRLRVSRTT
jgi:uncharacterized membrane protein